MANLKEIRTRLSSVKSTKQITSAMKMVAAAKLRKAQDKIVSLRPYADKLDEILQGITAGLEGQAEDNVYRRETDNPQKILLVVVTSNRGLCGAFNANVQREVLRITNEKYREQKASGDLQVLAIGKKGADFLQKRGFRIIDNQSEIFNNLTFDNVQAIARTYMDLFINGEFDRIEFIYNQFRNAATQDLSHETYLPLEPEESESAYEQDFIFEPTQKLIINELIPKSLKVHFYRVILDSYVAEHGARMTAMHKATDNATELIRDLTLEYNKARQASITNEILEVVSGAEALV